MPRNAKRARHTHHMEAMRRDITSLAARLMAEDGIASYGLAKRKAAKQLGAPESEALPANQEIEAALRSYLTIFQQDELRERLALLRREALEIMRRLEMFNPYLTGPVLDGIAGRYAEAEIELYADSAKDVEIFLLNHGMSFDYADIPHNGTAHGNDQIEARLRLDGKETTLLLSIYPYPLERVHRRNPHTGQVALRAGIEAVAALIDEQT
ncbi:MAG: nucleotidyltransferase [Sterolibacterium sp.]